MWWTVFLYILIGAAVGIIARLIIPGKENMGCLMTIILGALGAFIAGLVGQLLGWYTFPSWWGFLASIVLAIILIVIYAAIKRRR